LTVSSQAQSLDERMAMLHTVVDAAELAGVLT